MTGRLYAQLLGLCQRLGDRAIVIVGGLRKEPKLRLINERFGITAEWHEIDADSQRGVDAMVTRIRNGRVGAVVLLHGLMAHKVSERIVQACSQYNVPFTKADRGGTGSLEQAFNDLERRLTSA